jgi:hypothetical protein
MSRRRTGVVALTCLLVSGPGGLGAAWSAFALTCFDTCPDDPVLWRAGLVAGVLAVLSAPVVAGVLLRSVVAVLLAAVGAVASVALWVAGSHLVVG